MTCQVTEILLLFSHSWRLPWRMLCNPQRQLQSTGAMQLESRDVGEGKHRERQCVHCNVCTPAVTCLSGRAHRPDSPLLCLSLCFGAGKGTQI